MPPPFRGGGRFPPRGTGRAVPVAATIQISDQDYDQEIERGNAWQAYASQIEQYYAATNADVSDESAVIPEDESWMNG